MVYLVGAGPGDIGLLTLRGASLLREADVIVYDSLVNPRMLEFSPQARKILAGKKAGHKEHSMSQKDINQLLLAEARKAKTVVRLKGGDPFVFGRGGEEAAYLKKHGILFEVVPGVSAGHAVPAYAGIPITDRRCASTATFVTANEDPEKEVSSVDWKKIAALPGTLVLFMGLRSLGAVTKKLIQYGKSSKTLVTVIEEGTLPSQRVIEGDLSSIARKVKKSGVHSPAITVIGDVNRFRKELAWYEKKPLQGKRILITRAKSQASALRTELERYGAEVLEYPAIQIEPPKDWKPLDQVIRSLSQLDWIVFTSVHGVEAFFSRLKLSGKDARVLASLKVAVIGEATAFLLEQKGILPDLIPEKYTSEALFELLKSKETLKGKHFLLPRTDIAPEFLKTSLEQEGARVTEVVAYRTLPPSREAKRALNAIWKEKKSVDYVTFTSASTVHHFFEGFPKSTIRNLKSKMVTMGPVTSKTLQSYGVKRYREAREHTISGLVKAILER